MGNPFHAIIPVLRVIASTRSVRGNLYTVNPHHSHPPVILAERLCRNYFVEKRGFLKWPITKYCQILGVKPLLKMSIFRHFSNYDTVSEGG
jgi:hypothetical protein